MKVKWLGTACILLESGGTQLLFDPFIPLNDNIYKPSLDELSSAWNIFVTHGHLDHTAGIPIIWKHSGGKSNIYCTTTPRNVLISKGIKSERVHGIIPGDILTIGSFEIRVLKGKHIEFNMPLKLKTLLNPRIVRYRKNLKYILKENKVNTEAGETVVYDVRANGKQVLVLGSLNLDADTQYPKNADILILPLQGRSDIIDYGISFVDYLRPKKVLLDHFDDTFPPISSEVDIILFTSLMSELQPEISVICRKAGSEWLVV